MWIFVAVCLALVVLYIVNNCRRPDGYPPGPPLLPIIGTWYCLPPVCRGEDVAAWRKKYGNIIGHRLGYRNLVIITGYDEVVAGLKHPQFQTRLSTDFQKARSFQQKLGFFFADGEQWAKVRSITFRYFGQVYTLLPELVREELDVLSSTIESGSTVEINRKFVRIALHVICSLLIGSARNNYKTEIQRVADLTNRAFDENRVTSIEVFYPFMQKFYSCTKSLAEATNYTHEKLFKRCIEEHKKTFNPSVIRDYIDAFLLEAEKEKELGTNFFTDLELSACLLDLLQAGNESTGNTFGFTLLRVALNPQVQDKMHEEIDRTLGKNGVPQLSDKSRLLYCQAVIHETLRINSISLLGVSHIVSADTEFQGYIIPKNTAVFFAHDDILKNPEFYDEPGKFKPERYVESQPKVSQTNFGLGKRSCIGEILVRNTLFLLVVGFFQRYKIQLPKGQENPTTTPKIGITNSFVPFNLIFTERQ